MRTRRQWRSELGVDPVPASASSNGEANAKKRKREDASAAGGGGRSRRRTQAGQTSKSSDGPANQAALQTKSQLVKTSNGSADSTMPPISSSSDCKTDEVAVDAPSEMALEKDMAGRDHSRSVRIRRAPLRYQESEFSQPRNRLAKPANRASPITENAKDGKICMATSSPSIKKTLADGRNIEETLKSTQGREEEQFSSGDKGESFPFIMKIPADVHHNDETLTSTQGKVEEQSSSRSSRDAHAIEGTPTLIHTEQSASREDDHHNEATLTASKGVANIVETLTLVQAEHSCCRSRPCHCKSKASAVIKKSIANGVHRHEETSIQGEQSCPGTRAISTHKGTEEHPCTPGPCKSKSSTSSKKMLVNGHHKDEIISSKPGGALKQSSSDGAYHQMNAAKLRWKNLARSIMNRRNAKCLPASVGEVLVEHQNAASKSGFCNDSESHGRNSSSVTLQTRCNKNGEPHITQQVKKRKRSIVVPSSQKASRRKSVVSRAKQRLCRQQAGILKRMNTWLTEAKFPKSANEQNNNVSGEAFIMTEDERQAFAQNMVKSCQKNTKMRVLFLESVKMLAESGLMHSAASNLLQEGPCEEAQTVMNAWEDFQQQDAMTEGLPMNLLNAVNQLHEKRGDLSNKLSSSEDLGVCALSRIDGNSWKFQLPRFPLEEKAKLNGDGNTTGASSVKLASDSHQGLKTQLLE